MSDQSKYMRPLASHTYNIFTAIHCYDTVGLQSWHPAYKKFHSNSRQMSLFRVGWLIFNGTFSTNTIYHATVVLTIKRRAKGNEIIKQNNTTQY